MVNISRSVRAVKSHLQPKSLALILSFSISLSLAIFAPAFADTASELQAAQNNYAKNSGDKSLGVNLARAYLAASKPAEAAKVLEPLAEAAPNDAVLHYMLGESLLRNMKFAEASFELKRAFNIDSTKGEYAVRAGEAILAQKRFDELSQWCTQVMAKITDPASRIALETLAQASRERKTDNPKKILDPRKSEGQGSGGTK